MALTKLSRSIVGEVAIVTGAASGMGRATAHLFGDQGAKVALIDQNSEAQSGVLNELTNAGYDARAWALDLSQAAEIYRVVEEIAEHFGRIDILINNAGFSQPTPFEDDGYLDVWGKSVAVMLTAQMHMVRASLPHLRESPSPRIVNIASTEALGATRFSSAYSAAKSGVTGLTRSLAVEFGAEKITVNCICPGPINTGMTSRFPDEEKAVFAKRRTVLRRYGDAEEVAHASLNFCLPASQYITGAVLPVDGGLTIRNA